MAERLSFVGALHQELDFLKMTKAQYTTFWAYADW